MRLFTSFALFVLIAAHAPASHAEPVLERGSASVRYRQAHEAMSRKHWPEARLILLELWSHAHTYDVAATLGQVEYQLGNYPSAAEYMAFAVAHVPPKESPANLERYHRALAELRTLVGSLRVRAHPSLASLRVDGSPRDVSLGEEVFVAPGVHVVEARLGDRVATRKLSVLAGERQDVELDLGTDPLAPSTAAGPSQVLFERAAEGEKSWVPVYVGGGLVALGLGAAVGFGVAADSATREASQLRRRVGLQGCVDGTADTADCRAAESALDRQHRYATLSSVGIGVAVTSALATVGYVLLWPESAAEPGTVALGSSLAIDPDGAALRFEGAF